VTFYGVLSANTEQAVDLFRDREQAEAFIAEVEQDEPETAALLSVVALEFEQARTSPAESPFARLMELRQSEQLRQGDRLARRLGSDTGGE